MGALPPRDVGSSAEKADMSDISGRRYSCLLRVHIKAYTVDPPRTPLPPDSRHTARRLRINTLHPYEYAPRHLHCFFIARRHPTGSTSRTRRWLRIAYASCSQSLGARLASDGTPAERLCLYDFLAPLIGVSSLSHTNPFPFSIPFPIFIFSLYPSERMS